MGTEWRIKAVHLGNCNCAYGCPCKFSALPTHGNCRSVLVTDMTKEQISQRAHEKTRGEDAKRRDD